MSMILDALRKADAERERGSVPGLHAQPATQPSFTAAPAPRAVPWPWIVSSVLAVLVVALAWYAIAGREAPQLEPIASPAPQPEAAATAPEPRPGADKTGPPAPAAPWPQPERAAPKPAAPDPARVYSREQLPDAVRAALPSLSFGGSMYSSNPANRSLIVNGALHRENDALSADLVLEQIGPKTAVFRFRGYRIEIPY